MTDLAEILRQDWLGLSAMVTAIGGIWRNEAKHRSTAARLTKCHNEYALLRRKHRHTMQYFGLINELLRHVVPDDVYQKIAMSLDRLPAVPDDEELEE